MPVLVSDWSWTQTDSMVFIHVPLKGVRGGNVDVVSTDEYVKVHFPPYLCELFLSEPVDDERSTMKISNGAAIISLVKRNHRPWQNLMMLTDNKEKKKEMRQTALLRNQEKLSAQSKAKTEKQQQEKKYALETMMKMEKDERETIQKVKDAERDRTTAALEEWRLKQKDRKQENVQLLSPSSQQEDARRQVTADDRRHREAEKKKREVPAPRVCGHIQVSFTPRVFPTALRESRVAEEDEWLQKQAAARRAVDRDADELKDLKEEEKNPEWLKDKGDKYFLSGNFLSAVNAYNLSIRLNTHIPAVFSNRAACHLKLGNLHKAIEDSSQALELLIPPVPANAAARVRAHVRRGSAFCRLQLYVEGLQDYMAALKIFPDNDELQEDAKRIRDILQQGGSNSI